MSEYISSIEFARQLLPIVPESEETDSLRDQLTDFATLFGELEPDTPNRISDLLAMLNGEIRMEVAAEEWQIALQAKWDELYQQHLAYEALGA